MSRIKFRSDCSGELIDAMASDAQVVKAARISTVQGYQRSIYDQDRDAGLIRYLMKNRHGTPFEHNAFTFRVECPIFVAREFMRHRIASYNEESARYKELEGVFWKPDPNRGLTQTGKPGHYEVEAGTPEQHKIAVRELSYASRISYEAYQRILDAGICREVARGALTVSVYTSFYVTMNARGLMNFLSLRIDDPSAAYPSKPLFEIDQAARTMEKHFAAKMPLTYSAFVLAGRVAP